LKLWKVAWQECFQATVQRLVHFLFLLHILGKGSNYLHRLFCQYARRYIHSDHGDHRCAELTAVASHFESKIKDPLDELSNDEKELNEALQMLEDSEKLIQNQTKDLQKVVKKRTQFLTDLINEDEKMLIDEINKRNTQKMDEIAKSGKSPGKNVFRQRCSVLFIFYFCCTYWAREVIIFIDCFVNMLGDTSITEGMKTG
jgi:Skp family chaperone for outer membrane proteins